MIYYLFRFLLFDSIEQMKTGMSKASGNAYLKIATGARNSETMRPIAGPKTISQLYDFFNSNLHRA